MVCSTPLAPLASFHPLGVWKGSKKPFAPAPRALCTIFTAVCCSQVATPDSLLVLACLPTSPVHQMFFLGFLPTPSNLRVYNPAFLLVGGSLAFFLTLVHLYSAFDHSASLFLRCSLTCKFSTLNTLHF